MVSLADVTPEPVEWLWPDRLPLGKLCLLVGDPKVGKSHVSTAIAAAVSTGAPWPDSPGETRAPAGVVMITGEDGIADTVVPRLCAAGADRSRIEAIRAVHDERAETGEAITRHLALRSDVETIARAIDRVPGCQLVVVDPLSAYMVGVDTHRNGDIRSTLSPLADVAARSGVCILAVEHLNKRSGESSSLYRVQGSIGLIGAARSALLCARDRRDPSGRSRLLLPLAQNLTAERQGLAYVIESASVAGSDGAPIATSVVTWGGETDVTADAALEDPRDSRPGPEPEALNEAVEYLRQALELGPRLVTEIRQESSELGISAATLRRAKEMLCVVSTQRARRWTWSLPAPPDDDPEPAGASQHPSDAQVARIASTQVDPEHLEHLTEPPRKQRTYGDAKISGAPDAQDVQLSGKPDHLGDLTPAAPIAEEGSL